MAIPLIGPVLEIIANATGLWRAKDARANAPDVKAAAEAAKDAAAADAIRQHIADEDTDKIKQDITPSGGSVGQP